MAGIQKELNQIKNAIYGRDVRQAIHDGIKKAYDDAAENGNANMEVIMARGQERTLGRRLDKINIKATEANAKANNPLGTIQTNGQKIPLSMFDNDALEAISGDTEIELSKGYLDNNRGVQYPLRNIVKNGELHSFSETVKDILLDVKVINAKKGKYYTIDYIANGISDSWGFTISEYDKETYSTEAQGEYIARMQKVKFSEPEGNETTRVLDVGDMTFIITLDYTKISFNRLNLGTTEQGVARGAIIDESCYIYRTDSNDNKNREHNFPVAVKVGSTGFLVKSSYSSDQNLIIEFDKLGVNEIYHLKRLYLQEKDDSILNDDFRGETFYTASSDWISPYRIEALNNGNGNGRAVTGGNHGTDGGAGFATARGGSFEVFADGKKINPGETIFAKEKVVARVTNYVSAYNVIDRETGDKRDSLKEIVTYTFTPNVMTVMIEMIAMEDLRFHYHQGLGMQKGVWDGDLYYMEDITNPNVLDAKTAGESGTIGEGCLANRWVIKNDGHAVIGFVDSDMGLGTLEHLENDDFPMFRNATKQYSRVIGRESNVNVNKDDSLYLSGGYVFTKGLTCAGAETAYKLNLKGKKAYAVDFFNAVNLTYLEVDEEDIGKEIKVWKKSDTITHESYITSRGLRIKATGYGQIVFTVD